VVITAIAIVAGSGWFICRRNAGSVGVAPVPLDNTIGAEGNLDPCWVEAASSDWLE
jgi:hypothetical protein